jgi:hypothetical protein
MRAGRGSSLPALGLVALLALAVGAAGCGAGSSTSSSGAQAPATAPAARSATSSRSGVLTPGPAEISPGSSITGYGAEAGGSDRAAVIAAAHSFLAAMAASEDARLCADLAAPERGQLAAFGEGKGGPGGCAAALGTLLTAAAASEARRAAAAPVTSVRIKGDTAFVLFRPKGGVPSYLVMKEEAGAWKAISLAPGTPIDPTATP